MGFFRRNFEIFYLRFDCIVKYVVVDKVKDFVAIPRITFNIKSRFLFVLLVGGHGISFKVAFKLLGRNYGGNIFERGDALSILNSC